MKYLRFPPTAKTTEEKATYVKRLLLKIRRNQGAFWECLKRDCETYLGKIQKEFFKQDIQHFRTAVKPTKLEYKFLGHNQSLSIMGHSSTKGDLNPNIAGLGFATTASIKRQSRGYR
jgi:hypothetical protein